jgi:hypothetical protein
LPVLTGNVNGNYSLLLLILYPKTNQMKNQQSNRMKKSLMRRVFAGSVVAGALLAVLFFQACKKSDSPAPKPAAPAIGDFNPKKGQVGVSIVITGTNFDSIALNNVVEFNGVAAVVTQASSTQLTVHVPQGAASGKISTTVNGMMAVSSSDFTVDLPLTLSTVHGITNQLVYLTGGDGFGAIPDSNGFVIYGTSGTAIYADVLGYTSDSLVLLIPYIVPGVYNDSARVDGKMISLGTFKVDTPALTQMGIVSNVTPGTAGKGTNATITVINGSNTAGSTTVALVALNQKTSAPAALNCTVNSLTAGPFGTTAISFVIPDGVVAGNAYAIKVTVNGLSGYGGLNAWFTAQ